MKRMLSVLMVSAWLLMSLFAVPALGDIGDPDAGHKGEEDQPGEVDCDWYGPFGHGDEAWWEYWCFWPGWGWKYVFWVWA